jgi:cytochrome c553
MEAAPLKLRRAGAVVLTAALIGAFFEPSFAQQPTPSKPSPKPHNAAPALHGRRLVEAFCAGCHGVDGNTTIDPQSPKLAGQKAA